MSERYFERIGFSGDSEVLVADIAQAFDLGGVAQSKVLEVGYEDCNVRVDTDQGKFVVKAFASFRDKDQIDRYVDIMRTAIAGGVHHPVLHKSGGEELYAHRSGISLVVMDFIEGSSYFDTKTIPTDDELDLVMAEAVKIHSLNTKPEMLFDSWAIPHIHKMYDLVEGFLDEEGKELAAQVMQKYDAIDISKLSACFVHGDIIATNTLKDPDGKIWILDFAVANVYPKIQELAVICSSLLADKKSSVQLHDRVTKVISAYLRAGGGLNNYEQNMLGDYALVGVAMEFLGGHKAKFIDKEDAEESQHWIDLGLNGLREALV